MFLSQRGLDRFLNGGEVIGGFKAGDDLAFSGDEKFCEVPLDIVIFRVRGIRMISARFFFMVSPRLSFIVLPDLINNNQNLF